MDANVGQRALVAAGTALWRVVRSRRVKERLLRAFLFAVRGRRVKTTVDGLVYELDLSEMIDVGVFLGRFEPEVAAAIDALCTPGWVVLDIGANIGAHALRLGRRIGTAGCVYAFEPTSYAFEKLERNVALNPTLRIIPVRAALSDRSVPAQTISYRSSWRTDGQRSVQSSVVDFVRLDDWCAQRGVDRIDLIKIDVDGNEYSVVTGAMKMITSSLPLFLLEAGAWHFEDRATNPWAILEGLGYRFWNAMRRKPYNSLAEIRAELPPSDPDKGFSINLVASTRALEATW